jgi:hypothetical protein
VHPRRWDDPFENFILNCPIEVSAGRLAHNELRKKVFGQCWSLHREADLMWRAYSPQKTAIKLQTTVELLLKSFFEACGTYRDLSCFIGRVRYLKKEAIANVFDQVNLLDPTGAGIAQTLLVKRYGFRSEREVRLVFLDHEAAGRDGLFKYRFDVNKVIDKAVLDPRMADKDVVEWTERFRRAGFTGKLIQSGLYRPPDFRTLRATVHPYREFIHR